MTFYASKDDVKYVISMNENALSENSSFHGYDYHSFNNQEDLWKFLADVRSKEIKCAQDLLESQMKILFEKDVLMKDIAPIIKGLNALGYSGDRIILYKSNGVHRI